MQHEHSIHDIGGKNGLFSPYGQLQSNRASLVRERTGMKRKDYLEYLAAIHSKALPTQPGPECMKTA
jgi:hypothetical protein